MMKSEWQPAYVLHSRPYRDTSMLVDFLTPDFGRITLVARGVRSRKAPKRHLLNPFIRLLISFQGKTDLKLLTQFESDSVQFQLSARHLYSGFYANELLVRLLPEYDSHPDIFESYQTCLQQLHEQQDLEPVLRCFELQLLKSLGYGVQLDCDARTGEKINADRFYFFDVHEGFFVAPLSTESHQLISGLHVLAIAAGNFSDAQVRVTAKKITRLLLQPLLGNKPLLSRELFS